MRNQNRVINNSKIICSLIEYTREQINGTSIRLQYTESQYSEVLSLFNENYERFSYEQRNAIRSRLFFLSEEKANISCEYNNLLIILAKLSERQLKRDGKKYRPSIRLILEN